MHRQDFPYRRELFHVDGIESIDIDASTGLIRGKADASNGKLHRKFNTLIKAKSSNTIDNFEKSLIDCVESWNTRYVSYLIPHALYHFRLSADGYSIWQNLPSPAHRIATSVHTVVK